jgi:hypothetical protein
LRLPVFPARSRSEPGAGGTTPAFLSLSPANCLFVCFRFAKGFFKKRIPFPFQREKWQSRFLIGIGLLLLGFLIPVQGAVVGFYFSLVSAALFGGIYRESEMELE